LVIVQLDAQFPFNIFIYSSVHVSSMSCSSSGETDCASSWTITKNHCMMHGQQNVKNAVLKSVNFKFAVS